MNTCFRVISDKHSGYEVQIKKWWYPFWIQKHKYGSINIFPSLEAAKKWIDKGCPKDRRDKKEIYWTNCE